MATFGIYPGGGGPGAPARYPVRGSVPRVNWSHPLARELRAVVIYGRLAHYTIELFTPRPNGYVFRVSTNINSWPNGSRIYNSKYGLGINSGSSGMAGAFQAYPGFAGSIRSTTLTIGKLSTSTASNAVVSAANQFGNGYVLSQGVGGVAANIRLGNHNGTAYVFSPTTVTVDTTNVHCFAAINTAGGASNVLKLLVDGDLKDSWAAGFNPGFGGSSFQWNPSTGNRHDYISMVFARELSVPELLLIQENPYQIFGSYNRVFASTPGTAVTLSADSGAYNLTGVSAELLRGQNLSADSGAYNLTGAAATLSRTVPLDAASGSYSLVGSDATLNITRILSADSGAYNLTGSSADLPINRSLSADSGAYNVTGAAATLTQAKVISADAGSYALDGQAASFVRTYNLLAAAGAFNLTGSDATLSTAKTLSAGVGSYNLTGLPASLTKFSLYPDPGDVREGVVYGPGGIYVGTLKVGGKILFIFDD